MSDEKQTQQVTIEEIIPQVSILKITNPLWLGNIAPKVADYFKIVAPAGITYESLYAYFANAIQFGGEANEFWVAFLDDVPSAFCNWSVMPLPHVGVVHCWHIYSWGKDRRLVKALMEQFIKFGQMHNAPLYSGMLASKSRYNHFAKVMGELGIEVYDTGHISTFGRKGVKDG